MARELPEISPSQFRTGLERLPASSLSPSVSSFVSSALFEHYAELRRWNPRLSLVGPGTVREVITRHYGESLAALGLLRSEDRFLVDLGSGAGFPGLVLAAARPDLEVTLVEARERKWAFLRRAARRSGLSCRCLNARVEDPLPEGFPDEVDVFTSRALAIDADIFGVLLKRFPRARYLLWTGHSTPCCPEGLVIRRELSLPGSESRRILEISPESYDS